MRRTVVEDNSEALMESTDKSDLPELERRVVSALERAAATERAPARLRARIEADRPRAASVARRSTALYGATFSGAVAVVALLIVLVLPAGTPGGPSVSQAASLAVRGPTSPAPGPDPRAPATRIDQEVGRVYFPNWFDQGLGWAAVGQRIDQLRGRRAVTVYYQGHGTRIAYTIVSGRGLPPPKGSVIHKGAERLRTMSVDGRLAVTWRRAGHTCVLSGMGVTADQLELLAAWPHH
jgi:hypothetical protein